MASITAASIDKYIGATESAVRQGLNQASSGALTYSTVESQQAIVDIVALSDRADSLMFTYGADARVSAQKTALTNGVNATALSRVGLGANSSLASPTTASSTRTLENGTTRTTQVTTLSRTVENTAAESNGGVGVQRVFTESVSRDVDGYAKAGTSLAATERSDTSVTTTTADAANRTRTTTTESQAVIRTEGSAITVSEQRLRTTVLSLKDDGSIEQSVREQYLSVSTDDTGAIVGTTKRESSETTKLATDGTLTVARTDESVTASVDSKGYTNTATTRVSTNISIDASADQVGAVSIKEVSTQAASRVGQDGAFESSSATQRNSSFTGVGTVATGASTLVQSDASWIKADGSVGGGSVERYSKFAVRNGDLTSASGYVRSANISLREDNKVEVKATSDTVKAVVGKDGQGKDPKVTSATPIYAVGKDALTIDPTETKTVLASSGKAGGQLSVDGNKVSLTVTDSKGKAGPTVTLDLLARQVTASSRNGASSTADLLAGTTSSKIGKGNRALAAYASADNQGATLTALTGVKKKTSLAIQADDGQFAIGTNSGKKGALVFSPAVAAKALNVVA